MTTFSAKSNLEQYLKNIDQRYAKYAEELWANEIHSTTLLGTISLSTLLACGVRNPAHAEHIIAHSKPTGKGSVTLHNDFCDKYCICMIPSMHNQLNRHILLATWKISVISMPEAYPGCLHDHNASQHIQCR